MGKSKIEWTGSTWNPIRARNLETGKVGTHCAKISPGCAHCYAETHNARNLPHGSSGLPYTAKGAEQAQYFIDRKMLAAPLRREKPEVYFPCSLTDWLLFEPRMVAAMLGVAAATPRHTYQFLTKRPERFKGLLSWFATDGRRYLEMGESQPAASLAWWMADALGPTFPWSAADHGAMLRAAWPLPNVWVGVSVEDREHGIPRIGRLRQIPAALRFLSIEPLLEDLGRIDLTGIDWVIVGGESGGTARPLDIAWVRSIVVQCRAAGIPVFVKQLGQRPEMRLYAESDYGSEFFRLHGNRAIRLRDKKGGDPSEWPEDLRVREMPGAWHA